MKLVVYKTLNLDGKTVLPGSKSQSIRGMFFSLFAKGKSILFNVVDSDDTQDAMQICRALGAEIVLQASTLLLTSNGLPFTRVAHEIHTGNSGISTRFILPLLGLRKNYMSSILVTCSAQMQARPIKDLIDALNALGMFIQYAEQEDQFPILVSGQLKGGEVEIDGTTSQYLSALLISLPCAQKDSVVTVKDLHERPYAEMTLAWLNQQGIQYKHKQKKGIDIFSIRGGQCYQSFQAVIAGDFSSASCLLTAASLFPGTVELHGLDMNEMQGDKQLISLLKKMGANITIEQERIKIKGRQTLRGISIDANSIPDLLPALAVIATQALGKTEIFNVKQARIKETDRIRSMTEGLTRMGAKIEERVDGMTIYQSDLNGAMVKGYGDHRTVMALTIAGMLAEGKTVIKGGEAITKTYPGFIEAMKALGARVEFKKNLASRHIILFGFKYVGKTVIGKQLATVLQKKFIDLDSELENYYNIQHAKFLTCRQIMQLHGEYYYRKQEQVVLQKILQLPSAVIALGGGTVLDSNNQREIKAHFLLHIVASPSLVFKRIMLAGRPAFFDFDKDPYESFIRLWEERSTIYKRLTPYRINNSTSLDNAVRQARVYFENNEKYT